jgi:hypothetical protein
MSFKINFFLLKTEWMCCKFSLVLFCIEEAYKSLEEIFSHVFFCSHTNTFDIIYDADLVFRHPSIIFICLYNKLLQKNKFENFTLHLLFNIKFFFLLKSNCVEEQLSLIGTICSVCALLLFSDFVFMKFNRDLLAVEHRKKDKLQTLVPNLRILSECLCFPIFTIFSKCMSTAR